jgi:hypothetical protein
MVLHYSEQNRLATPVWNPRVIPVAQSVSDALSRRLKARLDREVKPLPVETRSEPQIVLKALIRLIEEIR